MSSVFGGRAGFGTDTSHVGVGPLPSAGIEALRVGLPLSACLVPKKMISKAVRPACSQRTYAHLCRCLQMCLESAQGHVPMYVVFIPGARFIARPWCGGGWHWRSGCLAAGIWAELLPEVWAASVAFFFRCWLLHQGVERVEPALSPRQTSA